MSSRRCEPLVTRLALAGLVLVALLCVLAPTARGGVDNRLHDASASTLDAAQSAAGASSTPAKAAPAPSLPHVSVPDRAEIVDWLRDPIHLALVVSVALFLLLLLVGFVAHRRPASVAPAPAVELRRESGGPGTAGRALTVGALAALVLFAVVAAVAWVRDETVSRVVPAGYVQSGSFSYQAAASPGAAYPDGVAETGEPIFRRLVRDVRFDFAYRLGSTNPTKVRGSIGLDLRLTDPETGWTRTVSLSRAKPFVGTLASTSGVADLRALARIQRSYRTSTGASVRTAIVSIVPRVEVTGYSGDTVIDQRYAPELTFALDPTALVPTLEGSGATTFEPRLVGVRRVDAPSGLGVRGVGVDVSEARSAALLGIGISLGALLVGVMLLLLRRGSSERDRITARFGGRIVSAREAPSGGRWVTELLSIDELVRVAETYDRIVVRVDEGGIDTYFVDDGVALYRFAHPTAARAGTPAALATDPG
jgi:hypothetical protein